MLTDLSEEEPKCVRPCPPVPNKGAIWAQHVEGHHRSLAHHPGGSCCLSSGPSLLQASPLKDARHGRYCYWDASRGTGECCMGAIEDACGRPVAVTQAAQLAGQPTAGQAGGYVSDDDSKGIIL